MRVLINRSDAIGDVLLTMPMAKLLKAQHPEAHVTFLVAPRTAELFRMHPYVDAVRVHDPSLSFPRRLANLIRVLRDVRPEYYFHVGGDYLASLMAWLLRVPFRGGVKSRPASFLFLNKGLRQKRSLVTMHEADYNMNLLRPMGVRYHWRERDEYRPVIVLGEEEINQAWGLFQADVKARGMDPELELIFIHPGMSGHTLNWSSRNYGRLIERLEEARPGRYLFVISHTPGDTAYLEGMRDHLAEKANAHLRHKVYFFDGSKRGLRDYMSVLTRAKLFVGPSTGTTHIASTLGVRTVGIYSPIKVQSALRWGPYTQGQGPTEIVVPDVVCGEQFKCSGRVCPYFECMGKIEVEDVIAVINKLERKILVRNTDVSDAKELVQN